MSCIVSPDLLSGLFILEVWWSAHLAAIYVPALQWVFRMEPIMSLEWPRIGLMSLSVILGVEIDKWLKRQ